MSVYQYQPKRVGNMTKKLSSKMKRFAQKTGAGCINTARYEKAGGYPKW